MASGMAVVRVAANTSAGTQDITRSGFGTPNAAVVIFGRTAVDTTTGGATAGTPPAGISVGLVTGVSNQGCAGIVCRHNVASAECHSHGMADAVIVELASDGSSITAEATFDSWITDGIRINWTNPPGDANFVTVILLKLKNAHVGLADDSVTTTETAPNFEGNFLVGVVGNFGVGDYFDDLTEVDAMLSVGFATARPTLRQCGLTWGSEDGAIASNPRTVVHDGKLLGWIDLDGTQDGTVHITGFTSTGFTWSAAGSVYPSKWLYLYGQLEGNESAWTGIINTPTSSGNASFVGTGNTPIGAIHLATRSPTVDTEEEDADANTFGVCAYDGTTQYSFTVTDQDNANPTVCRTLAQDKALRIPVGNVGTGDRAEFVSFDRDGFTLNFTAAGTTARKVPTLVFGTVDLVFGFRPARRAVSRKRARNRAAQILAEAVSEVTQLLWLRLQGRLPRETSRRPSQSARGMPYDFGVPLRIAPRAIRPNQSPQLNRRQRMFQLIAEAATGLATILRTAFVRRRRPELRRDLRRWGGRVLGEATPVVVGVPTVTLPVRVLPVFAPTHVTLLPVFAPTLPITIRPVFAPESVAILPVFAATEAVTLKPVFANTHVRIHRVEDMD